MSKYNVVEKLSPNFWEGRSQKITKGVVHYMVGTLKSTDEHFDNTASQLSAHWGFEDYNRHQYVKPEDTAWHARQANPFSIGYENSADTDRPPSQKTYENLIDKLAEDVKKYGWNPDKDIVGHSHYVATSCPGTVDMSHVIFSVKEALAGHKIPEAKPIQVIKEPPKVIGKKQLHLPGAATSWRVYPVGAAPVVGNEIGYLNPSLFGGLVYDIVGNPQNDVYTINTRDYGTVSIFAGRNTGAAIIGTNDVAEENNTPADIYQTVHLPAAAGSWRIYPTNKAPVIGNEMGYLRPDKFGGLTYEVKGRPQQDVVTIQTRDYGQGNIYVAPSTGAVLRG